MTDQEKVEKMFEIRKLERPDLKDSFDRISKQLTPCFGSYHGLLEMYNDRFKDDQGTLF